MTITFSLLNRHLFYLERTKLNQQNNTHINTAHSKMMMPSQQNPYQVNVGSGNHAVVNPTYRKKEDKWSSLEDICLLRTFQVFGEKYPLISLFALSHRSAAEVRNR